MQNLNFSLEKESKSPFHAYLLLSDSSKYVLEQAIQFASKINLSENYEDNHPDVRLITSENINTIGIEDVRDVLNKDNLSPISGKYKVIIFPPYKSLTEEASNALLKTLEEPSESSIFILTSTGSFWSHAKDDANRGIINTIKSRCRTVFVESETVTTYDFTFDDFSNFIDIRDFKSIVNKDKVTNLLENLEQLTSTNSTRHSLRKLINSAVTKSLCSHQTMKLSFSSKPFEMCSRENPTVSGKIFAVPLRFAVNG